MDALQTFEFAEKHDVRVVLRDKEPWFVAADVCRVLEIGNSRHAVSRLDDDEKDDVAINDAIGRSQATTTISESGLYALILTSRKPQARQFRRWVTGEVLPQIRRTGTYVAPNYADLADRVAALERAATQPRQLARAPLVTPSDRMAELVEDFTKLIDAWNRSPLAGRRATATELLELARAHGLFADVLREHDSDRAAATSFGRFLSQFNDKRDADTGAQFRREHYGSAHRYLLAPPRTD